MPMKKVYLAGSMSNLKGFGEGWRSKFSKWLKTHDLPYFNPCTEEIKLHKDFKIKPNIKAKWDKLPQILQEKIIKKDLKQVWKKTKFIVCYFTKYSTGTVSELTFAFYFGIPIYIVSNKKLIKWPGTVARAGGNKVFNSFEELQEFLTLKYRLRKK